MTDSTTSQKRPLHGIILGSEDLLLQIHMLIVMAVCYFVGTVKFTGFGEDTLSTGPYIAMAVVAFSGPWIFFKPCTIVWNKISPIKDRPTHVEHYVVHALAVLSGVSLGLVFFGLGSVVQTLRFVCFVLVGTIPLYAVLWTLRVKHYPYAALGDLALEEQTQSESLQANPTNTWAYLYAGVASTITFSLIILILLLLVIPESALSITISICVPLAVFNTALGSTFIQIGRMLWDRERSEGRQYFCGAALFLMFFLAISACAPNIDWTVAGLLNVWSLLAVYGIALVGYAIGGWALSRSYKSPSPAYAFA